MTEAKPDFADVLRRVAAADRPSVETLPAPEELIAYCHGELGEERMEALRELFARSPEATRLLLDCMSFLDLDGEERQESEPRRSEPQENVPRSAEPPAEHEAREAESAASRTRRPRPWRAFASRPRSKLLAAAAAGALVPLATWMALRHGDALPDGRVNVVVAALKPTTESLRSQPGGSSELVPADAVVVLHVPELEAHGEVRLVLRNAEDEVVWDVDGLVADTVATNSFVVELPAALLAPGRYRITLFVAGGKTALAHYRFQVAAP